MTAHPLSPDRRRAALEERFPTSTQRTPAGALDHAAAEFGDRPFVRTDRVRCSHDEVVEHAGDVPERQKYPGALVMVAALPRTPTGKTQQNVLRSRVGRPLPD